VQVLGDVGGYHWPVRDLGQKPLLLLARGLTALNRKFAFNSSLFICSIFAIVAGASPNWPVLGLFVCLSAFGGGGNLVLDTAVFLEYLPSKQQWLLTLMAAWWGESAAVSPSRIQMASR